MSSAKPASLAASERCLTERLGLTLCQSFDSSFSPASIFHVSFSSSAQRSLFVNALSITTEADKEHKAFRVKERSPRIYSSLRLLTAGGGAEPGGNALWSGASPAPAGTSRRLRAGGRRSAPPSAPAGTPRCRRSWCRCHWIKNSLFPSPPLPRARLPPPPRPAPAPPPSTRIALARPPSGGRQAACSGPRCSAAATRRWRPGTWASCSSPTCPPSACPSPGTGSTRRSVPSPTTLPWVQRRRRSPTRPRAAGPPLPARPAPLLLHLLRPPPLSRPSRGSRRAPLPLTSSWRPGCVWGAGVRKLLFLNGAGVAFKIGAPREAEVSRRWLSAPCWCPNGVSLSATKGASEISVSFPLLFSVIPSNAENQKLALKVTQLSGAHQPLL